MRNAVSLIATLLIVTGCSGANQSISTNTNPAAADTAPATGITPATGTTASNAAPTIAGQPVTALNENASYVFLPTAFDPNGKVLTFEIQNKPSWATFNTSTGELAGTPQSANVGTYPGIVISVSDGVATAALPTFSISVTQYSTGSVTLSWLPPTTNTNGTPLTNLAGYRIYYGTSASSLTHSVQITNPGIASYVISNLSPATWYFSLVSYNSADVESPFSQVVSKAITS